MHHPTDRIAHTTAFVTPVMEHWVEWEIAQWVHPMKDRSDDPLHHKRTLLPQSYISLRTRIQYTHNETRFKCETCTLFYEKYCVHVTIVQRSPWLWSASQKSPFILCVEVLSLAVKHNKNIKGIKINNVEYCIFQYADDTNFTLDRSQRTLLELLKTIKEFKACSGLKINMNKCIATWIGSKTGSNKRLCAHIPLP